MIVDISCKWNCCNCCLFDQSSYFLLHLGCWLLTLYTQKKLEDWTNRKKVTSVRLWLVVPTSWWFIMVISFLYCINLCWYIVPLYTGLHDPIIPIVPLVLKNTGICPIMKIGHSDQICNVHKNGRYGACLWDSHPLDDRQFELLQVTLWPTTMDWGPNHKVSY